MTRTATTVDAETESNLNTTTETDLPPKLATLEQYLRESVNDSEAYLKSREIAGHIDLSAKQIGALMPKLADQSTAFEIEKWGWSGATTWRIDPI